MSESRSKATLQSATTEPGYVWVFRYTYWDEAEEVRKTSIRFATLDVITCGLGQPVHASAKKIPTSDLIDGKFAE